MTTTTTATPLLLSLRTTQPLAQQLDAVFDDVDRKLAQTCPQLAAECRDLRLRTALLLSYAHRYDFGDVEANGFRTFARLVVLFGQLVDESCTASQLTSPPPPQLSSFSSVAHVLKTGLELCEDFSTTNPTHLFATSAEQFTHLLSVFAALSPQLDVIYGTFCSYWLCPSMRRAMTGFTTLMALYSCNNGHTLAKTVWDSGHRAHTVAHIAQNASVEFVKSFWGLTELRLVKTVLPSLAQRPKLLKDIYVPKQREWTISGVAPQVVHDDTSTSCMETVCVDAIRCRLLRDINDAHNAVVMDSVVLHVHGGGFVSQSPDSHETYLREWAIKLNGVPIVSVDYSLAPQHKYPQALQDVLDVYLWLHSAGAVQAIGFLPDKVVVCGDSAGGNLSCALSLVLADIRRAGHHMPHLRMPKAVVCMYTPFLLRTCASPSRLMTAVDSLLPLGVLLSCLEAYAPTPPPPPPPTPTAAPHNNNNCPSPVHYLENDFADDTDDDDFVHIAYEEVPPHHELSQSSSYEEERWHQRWCKAMAAKVRTAKVTSSGAMKHYSAHALYDVLYCSLLSLLHFLSGPSPSPHSPPHNQQQPWYRQPPDALHRKLQQLNDSTRNHYISPLLCPPLDTPQDISLFLIALTFDACLDDSIEMAKRWRGPVSLDVLDDLPHGFLNFVMLSREGRSASDLCVRRIIQSLNK